MTTKRYALTALLACGMVGTAGAATVFSANFEGGGTGADIGTLTINNSPVVSNVATSAVDATLGTKVLLVDQENPQVNPISFELGFTDTLSLAGSNTVSFNFDVAARRTAGSTKTHFVTGLDSNGDEVFRLVLGDAGAFGNGNNDRQRPGYGTSTDEFVLPGTGTPGSFWWGSDGSPATFDVIRDANFSLTISNDGWDVTTTKVNGTVYSTGSELPLFDGGTAADLAKITITSAGTNAGNYWDNFSVEGTLVPEPSSLALLGLGGLLIARRRR